MLVNRTSAASQLNTSIMEPIEQLSLELIGNWGHFGSQHTVPPTPKPAPLPSVVKEVVSRRSALLIRGLQKQSRILAGNEFDVNHVNLVPAKTEGEFKKRKRNRSAFISRKASRNYEGLLVELVGRSERERDMAERFCDESKNAIEQLNEKVKMLKSQIEALANQRKTQDSMYSEETSMLPKIALGSEPPQPKCFSGRSLPTTPGCHVKLTCSLDDISSFTADLDDSISLLKSNSSEAEVQSSLSSGTSQLWDNMFGFYECSSASLRSFC